MEIETDLSKNVKISTTVLKKIEKTSRDSTSMCLKLTAVMFPEEVLAASNIEGKNGKTKLHEERTDAILSKL